MFKRIQRTIGWFNFFCILSLSFFLSLSLSLPNTLCLPIKPHSSSSLFSLPAAPLADSLYKRVNARIISYRYIYICYIFCSIICSSCAINSFFLSSVLFLLRLLLLLWLVVIQLRAYLLHQCNRLQLFHRLFFSTRLYHESMCLYVLCMCFNCFAEID